MTNSDQEMHNFLDFSFSSRLVVFIFYSNIFLFFILYKFHFQYVPFYEKNVDFNTSEDYV